MQSHIASLRKRLRSLGINEIARPSMRRASSLPTPEQAAKLDTEFRVILDEVQALPVAVTTSSLVETELRSLRSETDASAELMLHISALARLSVTVQSCDNALSDLLEHIDSYPSPPIGPLTSAYITDTTYPPEQQMSARLAYTEGLVETISSQTAEVSDDARAVGERDRIVQAWEELRAMGTDRVNGHKSRPGSVLSSGRHSRASRAAPPMPLPMHGPPRRNEQKRPTPYSHLSAAPSGSKFLAPPPPSRQ